jgi:hypothetical protein
LVGNAHPTYYFKNQILVQHGVNKSTILNRQKAYTVFVLTFDFRPAVLVLYFLTHFSIITNAFTYAG